MGPRTSGTRRPEGSATACSTEAETRAVDPSAPSDAAAGASSGEPPTPVPDGEVRTQGLVMVLDDGDGPEMCLGGVAESYPPQCGGPALADFAWGDVGSEEASGVRWGQYALTGTYDGTTFTVSDARASVRSSTRESVRIGRGEEAGASPFNRSSRQSPPASSLR